MLLLLVSMGMGMARCSTPKMAEHCLESKLRTVARSPVRRRNLYTSIEHIRTMPTENDRSGNHFFSNVFATAGEAPSGPHPPPTEHKRELNVDVERSPEGVPPTYYYHGDTLELDMALSFDNGFVHDSLLHAAPDKTATYP